MKFGDNLKQIRKSKNISQEDLAERLGVSRQSISKWETGENYPSMFNIMCLCDIFNCKINNLVHESMSDINSLDEEIKMSVVKFKENEQKKMKGFTKVLYIITSIAKYFSLVLTIAALVLTIAGTVITPSVKIDNANNKISLYGKSIDCELGNDYLRIEGDTIPVEDKHEHKQIYKVLNMGHTKLTFLVTSLLLTGTIVLYISYKLLSNLSKLFKNIHDDNTPFSMDNVNAIRKLALYSLLIVLIPDVIGIVVGLILGVDFGVSIALFSYIFSLMLIVLSYIFKYGYEIQLDSKGTMYDEK